MVKKLLIVSLVFLGLLLGPICTILVPTQTVHSQGPGITPTVIHISWGATQVQAAFPFKFHKPGMLGASDAEHKKEAGGEFWKVDVDGGWYACWQDATYLVIQDTFCAGGYQFVGSNIYWYPAPPSGPTATPSPTNTPGATAVPPSPTPTIVPGATVTPQVTPITPTPFVWDGTPIVFPTLSPAQKRSFTVYCESNGFLYITVWGSYGLVINVDKEWCDPLYAALLVLLEKMSKTMPTRIYYRP